jgi:DNA-binding GntR family transcriptional regulator
MLQAGAFGFVSKPFVVDELLEAIASGDADAARAALTAHLAHGEERARAVVAGR